MTESKKKEKASLVYVRPLTEVHSADSCALLAGTFIDSSAGNADFGGYFTDDVGGSSPGGSSAGQANVATGAKAVILGQEFSFSDLWEE